MKEKFRQSMAWLHTWSGLVIGWALYMMFLAGTAAVFKDETSLWMRPEVSVHADQVRALELAQQRLADVAPDAQRWSISLPDARDPTTQVSWTPAGREGQSPESTREILDSTTGQPLSIRETRGGDLFYRLHYRFEIKGRNGWWLSGAAAVVMLVSLVCGVIIHKRIFKDFFTFRSRAAPQRSWLDAHNALAVLLLPFHFVITYTGLVPIMSTVMPWAIVANYAEDSALDSLRDYDKVRSAYSRDLRPDAVTREATGVATPLASLASVAAQARQRWGDERLGRVSVTNPGDGGALIEVTRHETAQIANRSERMYFAGDSGEFIATSKPNGGVGQVSAVMYGLHMVRFADPMLRWIVFLVGLASSAMIAAGLILWTVKRQPPATEPLPVGYRLVARLNVAGIVGLPIAMGALFWANRLLPVTLAERPLAETQVFFAAWFLALMHAAVRPLPRLWREQLWMAAAVFGLLPLLNALTTERHLLASVTQSDWVRGTFDVTMIVIALLFAFAARRVSGRADARSGVELRDRTLEVNTGEAT